MLLPTFSDVLALRNVQEKNVKIKRKHTDNHPALFINPSAVMRNKIVQFVGEGEKSRRKREEMNEFFKRMEEDEEIGKSPSKSWLKNNKKIVKLISIGDQKYYRLTEVGKRIYNHINDQLSESIRLLESLGIVDGQQFWAVFTYMNNDPQIKASPFKTNFNGLKSVIVGSERGSEDYRVTISGIFEKEGDAKKHYDSLKLKPEVNESGSINEALSVSGPLMFDIIKRMGIATDEQLERIKGIDGKYFSGILHFLGEKYPVTVLYKGYDFYLESSGNEKFSLVVENILDGSKNEKHLKTILARLTQNIGYEAMINLHHLNSSIY